MNIFRAYNRIIHQYPLRTQCLTASCLVAGGDIIAQKLIEKEPELNVKRTAKFAILGLTFVGPAIAYWIRFLESPFGKNKILLKPWQKVLVDQSTFNPSINFLALPILGLLNQQSFDQIKENIRNNYIDIMKNSYKVWPAIQLINFYLVPVLYRAIFVYACSLLWNTYFTWKVGEKSHHH